MKGTWQSDGSGGGSWTTAASQLPEALAVVGIGVVAIDVLMWVFHYIVDALTVLGLLAVVVVLLWVRMKWKRWQASVSSPQPQQVFVQAPPQVTPVAPPPAQQALPQGNVTNDYGHKLLLPAEWTPEQIRAFRGE